MEFDYYTDHSIAATTVVTYADVGGVVARVDHHRVVSVSTADVGDVLSGLLNGLDQFKYINYLLDKLPNELSLLDTQCLEAYLPWAANVQLHCK